MKSLIKPLLLAALALNSPLSPRAAFGQAEAGKPVSFYNDVIPIFKKSCTGCHHPGKKKGDLDLTTFEALAKGGKAGVGFVAGDAKKSHLVEEIVGDEPSMPKEGDPLSKTEIALIERWITEGAKNDTPANAGSFKISEPPTYRVSPVLTALAASPDGQILAVSGYHEVLLHKADGSGMIGRLVGESLRIDALAFSPDGKLLAASGGAPSLFGEIQVWEVATQKLIRADKIGGDTLYGVSWSPDGKKLAFGGADKSVRVINLNDGKEVMKFDNHTDWVLGTSFTLDGKKLVTGSRDRAMKLIDISNGQFIDDINKLLEGVLSVARHPKQDIIAYGGELGVTRIYKMIENQNRTFMNNDVNLVKEFERQPGPVRAVAFSPDGTRLAIGSLGGEVRVYQTSDAARVATAKGHQGAIYGIVFHPTLNQFYTGGYDGMVRVFDGASGNLIKEFIPVPLQSGKAGDQVAGK